MRAFISYLPGSAAVDDAHKFSEDSILARKRQGSTYKDIFYYLVIWVFFSAPNLVISRCKLA